MQKKKKPPTCLHLNFTYDRTDPQKLKTMLKMLNQPKNRKNKKTKNNDIKIV